MLGHPVEAYLFHHEGSIAFGWDSLKRPKQEAIGNVLKSQR
jgi:hypothetical protein